MEKIEGRSQRRKNRERKQQIILVTIIVALITIISTVISLAIVENKTKEAAITTKNTIQNDVLYVEIDENTINSNNEENNIAVNNEEENTNTENTDKKPATGGTRYRLEVNCEQNVVNVYEKDENGEYTNCVKVMLCSIGTATPMTGTYSLKKYGGWEWKGLQGDVYGQYATQITGNILFHSVPYTEKYNNGSLEYWEYDKLGTAASLGCIRLTVRNAKWIYDNCASGTKVMFYSDSNPGPLGKPTEQKISDVTGYNNWDPTDPHPDNPWKNYGKEEKPENIENTETEDNNINENVENTETNPNENVVENEENRNEISNNIITNEIENDIENSTDNTVDNEENSQKINI